MATIGAGKRPRSKSPPGEDAATAAATAVSPYQGTVEDRKKQTVAFIRSLRFSIPLSRLRAPETQARQPCPKCQKQRMYYCYDCYTVIQPSAHPPPLKLPLHVHVVLHPGEHRSKATTIPASIVSPDVHIHTFPDVPTLDPATTVVLYPSESAVSLDDVSGDLGSIQNVIFIDSTWQQSKAIARDPRVTGFRHIRIAKHESLFWRFQDKDPSYLATVEAIYYFVKRFVELQNMTKRKTEAGGADANAPNYHGEVDDLLFYYINQYIMVQENYKGQRSFSERHFKDYILGGGDWAALYGTDAPAAEASPKA